jgi:hypothetical protein
LVGFVNNIGRSTITDGNGTFKLQNISIHATLTISYVDLNPDNFRLTNYFRHKTIARKLFFLQNEELNQVLIQVYLTSGLQNIYGSTVLNTKKIWYSSRLIEPDILQSVQALPVWKVPMKALLISMFVVELTIKI